MTYVCRFFVIRSPSQPQCPNTWSSSVSLSEHLEQLSMTTFVRTAATIEAVQKAARAKGAEHTRLAAWRRQQAKDLSISWPPVVAKSAGRFDKSTTKLNSASLPANLPRDVPNWWNGGNTVPTDEVLQTASDNSKTGNRVSQGELNKNRDLMRTQNGSACLILHSQYGHKLRKSMAFQIFRIAYLSGLFVTVSCSHNEPSGTNLIMCVLRENLFLFG